MLYSNLPLAIYCTHCNVYILMLLSTRPTLFFPCSVQSVLYVCVSVHMADIFKFLIEKTNNTGAHNRSCFLHSCLDTPSPEDGGFEKKEAPPGGSPRGGAAARELTWEAGDLGSWQPSLGSRSRACLCTAPPTAD